MYSIFRVAQSRIFRTTLLLFSSILLITPPALAEDDGWLQNAFTAVDWSVSGSHRSRFEFDPTQALSFTSQKYLISHRTNILVEAGYKHFRLGGEVMDARAYNPADNSFAVFPRQFLGDYLQSFRNSVEPIQFYAKVRLDDVIIEGLEIELKGGRFTIDLGSGRLLGRQEFRNTVDSFLGGNLRLANDNQRLEIFYAQPFLTRNNLDPLRGSSVPSNGIKFDELLSRNKLWGAHYTYKNLIGDINAEAYAFYRKLSFSPFQVQNTTNFTPGLRFWKLSNSGGIDFEIEAATQFWKNPKIFGYFVHAEVGYEFDHRWRPRISLLFDATPGPGKVTLTDCTIEEQTFGCIFRAEFNKFSRFDTLFGRTEGDFGPTGTYNSDGIGLFTRRNGIGPFTRRNIVSPAIRFSTVANQNASVELTYRAVWREDPNFDLETTEKLFQNASVSEAQYFDAEVGHQIDARFDFHLLDGHVKFSAGGAVFFFGQESKDIIRRSTISSGSTGFITTVDDIRKYVFTSVTISF